MSKKLIVPALISASLALPLPAQSDFEYNLTRINANKIVLIGDWKPADAGKWREVIGSDEIYIHGFTLLNRASFTRDPAFGIRGNEVNAFERWLRGQYGLDGRTAWIALDMKNRLIVSGIQVPSPKEFDESLEQRGIKSPLKVVREFLIQKPDHLDAKGDLLTEVRRRALQKLPAGTSEDLNTETDLRTWGVLAAETDNAFSAPWQGIDIRFFRPDQGQPERYSKLMKNVFRKRIGAVESAIREQPADTTLWNIWAWMARSLTDYKWGAFVNSIEPFHFSRSVCPSPDVCVWLIEESRQNNDWEAVLKFAKAARGFSTIPAGPKAEWMPGSTTKFVTDEAIKDFPVKSAWAPHLEALLRLDRINEANDLYDEMIRTEGRIGRSVQNRSNNAQIAANAARSAGMEELAKIWEQGQQVTKVPYLITSSSDGAPHFYVITRYGSDYYKTVSGVANQLSPSLRITSGPDLGVDVPWVQEEGAERWALISGDKRILAQDTSRPNLDDLQNIFNRNNIKSNQERCRSYISEYGTQPGLELYLAFEIINDSINILRNNQQNTTSSDIDHVELQFNEAVARLNRILANRPEALINLPYIYADDVSITNQSMKSLSRYTLENIELLLKKRPSLESLWNQWFFWRKIEGVDRPIEPLIETLAPSPLSAPGTVPPSTALDQYLYECKKSGDWPKVIRLLNEVWDRELNRITRFQRENQGGNPSRPAQDENSRVARYYETRYFQANRTTLGDRVGVPLIEAYLNDNKPFEADEIFNAWLSTGGKFTNFAKVIELAKQKGQERFAGEWETKSMPQGR